MQSQTGIKAMTMDIPQWLRSGHTCLLVFVQDQGEWTRFIVTVHRVGERKYSRKSFVFSVDTFSTELVLTTEQEASILSHDESSCIPQGLR